MKIALTVAGSDPSGGAGIQTDIRVFTAFGIYSMAVISSITIQNTKGVKRSIPVEPQVFRDQIETVLDDIKPDVLKVGMLHTPENVEIVADVIERYNLRINVIDTVIKSKNGVYLLNPEGVESFIKKLIPKSFILTPNIEEAQELSGVEIKSEEDIKKAAKILHKIGAKFVIVKGGHFESGDVVFDTLFDGNDFLVLKTPKVNTENTHGTGCTFASAMASNIAKGKDVYKSFQIAKAYIYGSLANQINIGSGKGPLNHLWLSGT